jgi:hypothetical protein
MAHAAYTVKMDQEAARELVEKGGSLLLLDVPQGTALGVDQQVRRRASLASHATGPCRRPHVAPPQP